MSGEPRHESAGSPAPPSRKVRSTHFHLSLLGPFSLTDAKGGDIAIASKKNRLALAMLALAPGKALSREVLASALWGEHSDEQAMNSLRQAIAVLRKELAARDSGLFASLDTAVSLNAHAVGVDIDDFKRDAESQDAESLRRALGLWRGPFLAEISAGEENLDAWLAQQREFFSALYIRALDRLVTLAAGHEQVELAQRLVNFDNLREASHRRLMEAHVAQGERAHALRHYEKARKLLRDEIGVEPSPETQALRDQIAASDPKRVVPARAAGPPASGAAAPVEPERRITKPISRPTHRRWMGAAALAVLVLVAVAGAMWFQQSGRPTAVVEPSVAVLPFETLSGDPADARIADGITIDTITDLSRYWDFTVIARDSTEAYKGKAVDARQIGKDLNVSHVLKGSFQRDGNHVRITAQLIDAATGTIIWSERFDRPAGEVFAIQTEFADRIANTIGGHNGLVTSSVIADAKRKRPADLGAYEIYLMARDTLQNEMSSQGMIKAQKLIEQALEKDPTFARAYVIYAWTYAWRHTFEGGAASLDDEMLKYARRGVELDPMDADAHQALGYALGLKGDLAQAEVQFDESLKLNPNSFDILTLYSCWAVGFGKAKAGAESADRALHINPNYPNWSIACLRLGMFMAGRYEDAIRIQSRQPESDWNSDGFVVTAGSLAALGRTEEAKALVARGIAKFPGLLSIERFALNRGWSKHASPILVDHMRKAGFPACATDSELADTPNPVRLPECKAHAASSTPTIAVLPFENLSGDPANGRIADGITEDTITDLSRFRDFSVIARESTEVYKGKAVDVRQIGKDLNVGYVLEGSFQRDKDQVRISAQLIDTATGAHVWSEQYDRPIDQVFAIQSEVAERIASSLGGHSGIVESNDLVAARRKLPTNLSAYEIYLLARERSKIGITDAAQIEAQKLLDRAIQIDPTLSRAYTMYAWTYSWRHTYEAGAPELVEQMLKMARRAVELDPRDADAHAALGYSFVLNGDLKQGEVQFDEALKLNPNSFELLIVYSCMAQNLGRNQAGAQSAEHAIRLNPTFPNWAIPCLRLAMVMVGRYEDVVRIQSRQAEKEWNTDGFVIMAGSLANVGRLDEAKALAKRGTAQFPGLLSIERFALNRNWPPETSRVMADLMRKAGFPVCAKDSELADTPSPVRLPECKAHSVSSTPAIAVLPFDNLAGDETSGRIASGITDDIITELARFRDFDVIDRNSTEVYRGRPVDVRQIGKDLNAGYVLEGSFQRQGERLRINTQLIDTSTGYQIFSERFDNPSEDLFAVQAEVAAKVANSVGGVDGLVSINDLLAAKRKQETDLDAYALFLLGDEARRGLTEESLRRAVDILKRAIAADPALARAHTSLANAYARLMLFETDMGPSTKLMLGEARRAIELDPLDARAHAALAYATGMTGDLKQAEIEYDKALGLNPNSFDVLKSYACWAFSFGKGEAGAQAVDRAIRLNPRYPDHGVDCFRYALFMIGRYEDAIRTQHRLPEEKWNPDGFAMTAGSLAALGLHDEAKALASRGYAKFPTVLSVEKFALDRGWSPPESAKLLDLMRKAGFPLCAAKADLADNPKLVRLPECTAM